MPVKPATPKWQLVWMRKGTFHAYRRVTVEGEDRVQEVTVEAHCRWCAKLSLLQEHGGEIDLRGAAGECAERLKEYLAA